MKVKIGNHKSCLYQWDTGQFVVIDGVEQCNEIHFCNDRSKNALVVKIADQDGKRIANIPNILLQNDGSIYAYLFARNEDGSETRTSASFPVRGRKKPESYVYTETERWTYDNIERRLDDLEDSMTHGTVKSINGLIPDANGNVEIEIPEGITGSGVVVSETEPEDTSVLWVDTDEDEVDNVQDVINEALAQAKASGEFKGEPGYTPVKGVDYFDGDDYTLTDADKTEIAELAAEMVDVPEGGDSALYLVDAQNPNFEEAYAAYEAGKILQMTNLPSNDSYTVNKDNRIDFYTYIQGTTFGNVTFPSHLDFFGLVYSNTTGGYIEAVTGLNSNNICSIAYQPLRGYLTEHQDISGKLDASELPQAINTALEQAKASGEFKGEKGDPGEPGADGKTPVKGVDYFTEADKQEIAEQAAELVEVPEDTDAVESVNGKTGAVELTHEDVGAQLKTLVVTLTENADGTFTASHSPAEIEAHVNAGGDSTINIDGVIYRSLGGNGVEWAYGITTYNTGIELQAIGIMSDKTTMSLNYNVKDDIPKTLPNPNALTFTGAVTRTYDGSKPVEIEVPVIAGEPGKDGITPHIGDNGNWWIGDTDTGVSAGGSGGGTGGSSKAKTEKLLDITFTEATASVSVTLEHNFHKLFLVWNGGENIRTVDAEGAAISSNKLGVILGSTSFSWNSRKVGVIEDSGRAWATGTLLMEWTEDLSTYLNTTSIGIGTNTPCHTYSFFGGAGALFGTVGSSDAIAPASGTEIGIVLSTGFFAPNTRIVLVGEYYE